MDRAAFRGVMAALALLAAPASAQTTAEDVHAAERAMFGFGTLRQGADGNNPDAPNASNTDEARVGEYAMPPLFESARQQTPTGWPARREEMARMVEDNWAGRIPAVVSTFRVVWDKVPADAGDYAATVEEWTGRVIAPDGRSGPVISATIHFPQSRPDAAPSIINYTYVWPGGRMPNFGGTPPPDAIAQALDRGWAHVEYRPQLLQADSAATMQDGVIGLARWPRAQHDWGALRAWGWGASQLREELARDPRIDGQMVTLTGHSRFGKGVLVTAAFDHAFHDAHVSSSGAGGAKLMRRDFGERWENMSSSGAFHWFTPNIMNFARDPLTVHDLPVDAHMLIALRAPRPLFITSGLAEKGDSWVDPAGMWSAFSEAQPAWELFGASVPSGMVMPVPESREQLSFPLAWYQHGEGHVAWPAYDEFYDHAEMFGE
ncbi:hypothetical protein M3P36_13655 [Altererythrobacter sp. KTW20L]|uniref:glucuronyl esterase domain-containing protein n=1 Tax=Altererythrobacter sp. KTW20L TaxID=2942210 RepID=UPI0020C0DEFD|nr:hypothetical protein [Altererythrobacter sp. KTW20L]MCL6252086.1 hypothetical protein [Altererythrobacter sp. KTW20L]